MMDTENIKLLVVAGTADGVKFIAAQPPQTKIVATTFSQLGADCITPRPGLEIISGALDSEGFSALIRDKQPNFLVDLSHPFAVEVSANAKAAAEACGIPYLRFERQTVEDSSGRCLRFPDFPAAVEALKKIPGNIFLTIGSKNLHYFQALPDFHERCYMRVLAESRIFLELEEMQIDPAHVFAMKGVASAELNIALARQFNAAAIVSKDSGITGGIREKMQAATALNIPLLLIDRPKSAGTVYETIDDLNRAIYQA
jgi:precorrin-6A/cobalt-precorrin-6A reductase